ncbi:type-2 angiotensin II receptor [Protobothrops mucrosquamatus]|uniref:type-2 angiotensin II receptor n=1 Tax=Protobothrops mucrosquamatus TaxID=103944 RepID=UPI0010FAFFD0|nr:type-2 angiotensin II receptor [Protobothrops mucrosquamatus]
MHFRNFSITLATEQTPQEPSPTNVSTREACLIRFSSHQFVLIPVVYCVIFILGLVGNSLVITALCRPRSPKTVANVYIFNLAVADLLALTTLPFWAASYANGYSWVFGSVMCKLSSSILSLAMFASIFFITCLSVNRYQAIVRPFQCQQGTLERAFIATFVVWGLATLTSLPTFCWREVKYIDELGVNACIMAYPSENYATWSAATALMKNLLGFLFPMAIILGCYICIRVHLKKDPGFAKSMRVRDRVLKLVAAVVVAFLICWLPFHILTFLDALSWMEVISRCHLTSMIDAVLPFGLSMGFANSCINPLLYYFVGRQFRDKLQHLFKLSLSQFNSGRETLSSSKTSSLKTAGSLKETDPGGDMGRPLTHPLWVP